VNVSGVPVLVVGLGETGAWTARSLLALGASVSVTEGSTSPRIEEVAEELRAKGARVETGGHDLEKLEGELAVVSPGIPPTAPVISAIRDAGIDIISEIELGSRLAQGDLIAVTGTNGKTTTTSLLDAMLSQGGLASAAAGNIGRPLMQVIAERPQPDVIALEVSSFQLDTIETFKPKLAVLLNIAEDHTDWHGSTEAYAAAKAKITKNQTSYDSLLYNADDDRIANIAAASNARTVPFSARRVPEDGFGVADGRVETPGGALIDVAELTLLGIAGIEDSVAAAAAALTYGVDRAAVVRALKGFRALSHRMEVVADANGVRYIDDSKATNPHATLTAVEGLSDVVLIAGGRSKGIDLTPLTSTVPPVVAVVALGEARDEIERVFEGLVPVEVVDSMTEAVRYASKFVTAGGSVLLSPGCASLDMYESYAHRGEDFARAVKRLLEDREG
jgi:UDP-N-acetylmuramoylalanine--D-glutamate ligase